MSAASDLIEKLEAETGQRIDDPDSLAMAGLHGAISRIMEQSPPSYRERDDVVAGLHIQHQLSEAGQQERERDKVLVELLISGVSPDDAAALAG